MKSGESGTVSAELPNDLVSRRAAVAAMAGGVASIGAPMLLRRRFRLFPDSPTEYSERAVRLVQSTVVVDMLNQFRFADTAQHPPLSERWLLQPASFTRNDWQEYRTSGFRVFGLGGGDNGHEGALIETSEWKSASAVAEYPDWFVRVSGAAGDFERLASNGGWAS